MKNIFLYIVLFAAILVTNVNAQVDSYYTGINPNSPAFIADLEARIRTPYTRIDYGQFDETNVANFASRDTSGGQRVVTCAYSGYNYVYTAPFAWTPFSREHTWCQSWMPANGTSTPQYSDQHHLFPVHQNNANSRRSNHPLGNVSAVSYQFGEGKLGTNALGQTVYEPRSIHKGDAARALLYMCVRYDGIDGLSWNFDWLNNTKLPNLTIPEAPQDLTTLIEWHIQDPPDKWEVERNNYIESIQKNRNPFIDHPEWVSLIDFNNLTKQVVAIADEPTNYPTMLSTHKNTVVNVTWEDAGGAKLPSGYLLIGYDKDNYFIPMDGIAYNSDSNLSDGVVCVNIPFEEANSYDFSGADLNKTFYFRMYSYNGSGNQINYKIDGTVPSGNTSSPMPVELVSFTATATGKEIILNWETATEVNNYGFAIERRIKNEEWNKIGFVNGHGNSNSPKKYSFTDLQPVCETVEYRLKQIDFDGKYDYSETVEITTDTPDDILLSQNYPNPFNPTTEIYYQLPKAGRVSLIVYDIVGNMITTLVDKYKLAGNYHTQFSIVNSQFSSGVYFYQLSFGGKVITRKMLFVK